MIIIVIKKMTFLFYLIHKYDIGNVKCRQIKLINKYLIAVCSSSNIMNVNKLNIY